MLSGQESTEMKKFRIVNREKAFYLNPKSSMYSFQMGIHISINKKGENGSCCHFNLLNSSEHEDVVDDGKNHYFTPKRIVVVQIN